MKMDDEEVLRLTKRKLQTMKLKKHGLSLENLAVRDIIGNLMYYVEFPDKKENLRKLPHVLREKLLQEMMRRKCNMEFREEEKFKILMEVFRILLSSRTRSIELNGILSFCPDRYINYSFEKTRTYCEELLNSAATLAPNINELTIQRNHAIKTNILAKRCTPRMLEMMRKMLNLNRLFVELYSFEVAEILNLCKNLPNLQFLNVRLESTKNHPSAQEIKSSLFNVKEFIFESTGWDSHWWLRILCIRILPKIEVVQFYCNLSTSVHCCTKDNISSLGFTETSNLRHLAVNVHFSDFKIDSLPDMFPNITDLMVGYANGFHDVNVEPLFRFSKIKCLHFEEIKYFRMNVQQRFWQAYGGNLQALVLSQEHADDHFVDFNSIFKQCPKLEKIALLNVNIELEQIEFFAELKEFEWKFQNVSRFDVQMDLSNILAAPKLEILSIDGWKFDKAGTRKVISMIQNNEILAQLHTFQLHTHHEGDENDDVELRDLLFDLVKSSSAFLPKLTNVKFFSSNEKYDRFINFRGFGPYGYNSEVKFKSKDPFVVYEKHQDGDIYADEFVMRLMHLFESN